LASRERLRRPAAMTVNPLWVELKQQRERRRRQEREERREVRRAYYLRRRGADTTGLDYRAMFKTQRGRCRICKQRERATIARGRRPRRRALSADHDRSSGKIRALLCRSCNLALGYFHHDAELLRRAADYLERHGSSAGSSRKTRS